VDKGPIRLPPGGRKVEIHYTALEFSAPEKIRFRYRLEGSEKEWVEAGTRRVAYYTNLAPGDYRFRVIASNTDGVWDPRGTELAFSLQPFFYQTRLFQGLVIAAVALLLTGLYRLRVRRLERNEELLRERVDAAVAQVKVLGGMLPICASCKKIRDDRGYWSQIESYIREHSQAEFSHGICPDCLKKLYPDYEETPRAEMKTPRS
jgi:hypothetical protein